MAREGVDALAEAARGGPKPSGYKNTGVELITAEPVDGVDVQGRGLRRPELLGLAGAGLRRRVWLTCVVSVTFG